MARKLLPSGSDLLPKATTLSDTPDPEKLKDCDVVITNFHQLVSKKLFQYPRDFFDAVIVDEGHHQEAQSKYYENSEFDYCQCLPATLICLGGRVAASQAKGLASGAAMPWQECFHCYYLLR